MPFISIIQYDYVMSCIRGVYCFNRFFVLFSMLFILFFGFGMTFLKLSKK